MEVTSNAQAAQSLTSLHIKRNDLAVDRFFEEDRNRQIQAQSPISAYKTAPPQTKQTNPNEVFLKVDNRLIRFSLDDFLYLENVGDYVSIKTTKGSFMIHATMRTMEMKLAQPCFVKIHRSYIINVSKIMYIEDNAVVIDKKIIPISRAHKAELMEKLNVL
jgi:two-component system, LytTR family, response regulator LytT